jgi:uncharacterized protein YbjT (DUF2867 family)
MFKRLLLSKVNSRLIFLSNFSPIKGMEHYMLKSFSVSALAAVAMSTATLAADLVVVVGGTGGTGWETVKEAVAQGYEVRATTTNAERAKESKGEDGFTWVEMDARIPDDIRAAFDGADYVISTLGGSCFEPGGPSSPRYVDFQGVVNMADISKDTGIKQLVLTSAIGAGIPDQPLNQFCDNVQMWKWLGEDYLRDGKLPYTILRPGGLGTDEGGKQGITLAGPRGLATSFIQRADVAKVLVAALGNKGAVNKTIEIGGDANSKPDEWRDGFAALPGDAAQAPPLRPGQGE